MDTEPAPERCTALGDAFQDVLGLGLGFDAQLLDVQDVFEQPELEIIADLETMLHDEVLRDSYENDSEGSNEAPDDGAHAEHEELSSDLAAQILETGAPKGLICSVLSAGGDRQLGMLHTPSLARTSVKATCKLHRKCVCWLSCAADFEAGKQAVIEWLIGGEDGEAGRHHAEAICVKRRFGMRV